MSYVPTIYDDQLHTPTAKLWCSCLVDLQVAKSIKITTLPYFVEGYGAKYLNRLFDSAGGQPVRARVRRVVNKILDDMIENQDLTLKCRKREIVSLVTQRLMVEP